MYYDSLLSPLSQTPKNLPIQGPEFKAELVGRITTNRIDQSNSVVDQAFISGKITRHENQTLLILNPNLGIKICNEF
jgi:hypothetical protein